MTRGGVFQRPCLPYAKTVYGSPESPTFQGLNSNAFFYCFFSAALSFTLYIMQIQRVADRFYTKLDSYPEVLLSPGSDRIPHNAG